MDGNPDPADPVYTMTGLPGGAGQWSTYYNPVTGHFIVGTEQYCSFESTDGGATFTQVFGPDSDITPGNPHCGNLNSHTNDNSGNLIAAGQYGVWKAAGTPGSRSYTWTQVISTGGVVVSRALGRDSSGNLYWGHSQPANTPAQWQPAVFRSTDGGTTWTGFATGLPNEEAWMFLYNPSDGYMYAALQGAGNAGSVYRLWTNPTTLAPAAAFLAFHDSNEKSIDTNATTVSR